MVEIGIINQNNEDGQVPRIMAYNVDDHGLSEVIGFVLILALIIVAISIWMTYVVPAEGRKQEISHMDYVGDWFLDFKISADSLWMNKEIGVTDSSTLTLGSKEGNTQTSGLFLPMMQPIGSSGSLAINNTLDTITVTTGNNQSYVIPMSSLTYQSANNYWIQQEYYYQLGGIFLSQDINGATGVTNIVSPLISIYNVSNTAAVVIVPVRLNGGGTIAGDGNARLNFRLQEQPDYAVSNPTKWVKISVDVKDTQTAIMWRNLFKEIVIKEQLPKSWYPDQNSQPNPGYYSQGTRGVAFINISPGGPDVNLGLTRVDFFTSMNSVTSV